MSTLPLKARLSVDTTAPGELEDVLLNHFKSAHQVSPTEIVYPNDSEGYAVRLVYKNELLVDAVAGPGLTEADVAALEVRVQDDLLHDAGQRVGAAILFANVPVRGAYQYRDVFRIIPVPPTAPRPPFLVGEHPFQVQFRFPTSENFTIRLARRMATGREYELILSTLLTADVHSLGNVGRHHWVLLSHDDPADLKVAYRQEMYEAKGVSFESDEFGPLGEASSLAPTVDADAYYSRYSIRTDQELEVPSRFEELCDKYFALDRKQREMFLRSGFWFQHARRVHTYSRSACFTALISAVEALMPDEKSDTTCPSCRRSIGPGPTARFAKFVDTMAPGVSNSQRRELYSIRSALSHGGSLLWSDRRRWGGSLTPAMTDEMDTLTKAWKLVRLVSVNWLISSQETTTLVSARPDVDRPSGGMKVKQITSSGPVTI